MGYLAIIIITRKRGNCAALQLEARPPGLPPDPAHPRGKLSCPKTALGPV